LQKNKNVRQVTKHDEFSQRTREVTLKIPFRNIGMRKPPPFDIPLLPA
jgi:hypothetical protein